MSAGKFWLLTFLAAVIFTLIILEILSEGQVANLTATLSANEAIVGQARQQNELLRQLVQRIAVDSQRDPALLELLAKRGIRFSTRGSGANGSASAPSPDSETSPAATTPSTSPHPSP